MLGTLIGYGAGRHTATLSQEDTNKAMYYMVVSFGPGILSFAVPKFAVLILLAAVLDPGLWHKRIMWIVSVPYSLQVIGMLVINYAKCRTLVALWQADKGTCWEGKVAVGLLYYAVALGATSALFDFCLACYLTIVLFKFLMGWKKKLALMFALGFGYG